MICIETMRRIWREEGRGVERWTQQLKMNRRLLLAQQAPSHPECPRTGRDGRTDNHQPSRERETITTRRETTTITGCTPFAHTIRRGRHWCACSCCWPIVSSRRASSRPINNPFGRKNHHEQHTQAAQLE